VIQLGCVSRSSSGTPEKPTITFTSSISASKTVLRKVSYRFARAGRWDGQDYRDNLESRRANFIRKSFLPGFGLALSWISSSIDSDDYGIAASADFHGFEARALTLSSISSRTDARRPIEDADRDFLFAPAGKPSEACRFPQQLQWNDRYRAQRSSSGKSHGSGHAGGSFGQDSRRFTASLRKRDSFGVSFDGKG